MKKGDNIYAKLKQVLVIFGVLVGFCSMTVTDQWATEAPQNVEQAADDDAEPKEGLTIKSLDAITYSSQISVNLQSILLEELPEAEAEEGDWVEDNFIVSNASKALKILFRRIISPNAP
ncbi:MAG: hypothetical protein ABJG41_02370 [Cyclobacteriaceae bacterium]